MTAMPSHPSGAPHRRATRPPRALSLVRDPAPEDVGAASDWTPWHLDWDDDEGQTLLCGMLIQTLRSSLALHGRDLGKKDVFVGSDAFFAWVPHDPLIRITPDLCTLREHPRPPWPRGAE